MGVNAHNGQYDEMAKKWQRCRDIAAGQDAVRAHSESANYIPRLTDQTDREYQNYVNRAVLFNAYWRTVAGFVGMLFSRPAMQDMPAGIEPMMDNINLAGETLDAFSQECARECFIVGRVGVMVDYPQPPDTGGKPYTQALAEASGIRPSLSRHCAEAIINWKCETINNVHKLTMVVIEEDVEVPGKTEFEVECEKRYRVLDLVPTSDKSRAYRQRLFKIDDKTKKDVQIGGDFFPTLSGKPLQEIPFFILGTERIGSDVDEPPLIDLADLNLAHYRVSADYEHGCHFTGLPTPYVCGYTPTNPSEKLYVGSSAAWIFSDPGTSVGYLEFTGTGLVTLENNLKAKEEQMSLVGARMLMADTGRPETATSARIRHGGEASVLSAIAQVISDGLTRALTIFAAWAGAPGDVSFEINRDFFPVPMDAQMLQQLVAGWQAGALSSQTLFENLQRGDVISGETAFEDEQARIASEPPRLTAPAASPATQGKPAVAEPSTNGQGA